jgi:hypothetical protein
MKNAMENVLTLNSGVSGKDSAVCLNCGATLPERTRRGFARRYCSAKCRKQAWQQSQPGMIWVRVRSGWRIREQRQTWTAGQVVEISEDRYCSLADMVEIVKPATREGVPDKP